MRCIEVTEGVGFPLSSADSDRLREAVELLRLQLRPRVPLFSESNGSYCLQNLVGTIDLGRGVTIQVSPKVPSSGDWATAVVSLLTGDEGIHIAGDRRAGLARTHNTLLDALSGIYLGRLERAFRQEGPVVLMERLDAELPHLQGALNVSKWARTALWRPHVFPVSRTSLVSDNPFTRNLVFVAKALASVASKPAVKSGLNNISRDLSAGTSSGGAYVPPRMNLSLPEQWSAYKPAWSMASAILGKTSLLGASGHQSGVGLAVEAWPLLETLLERTLQVAQRIGRTNGRPLSHLMKGSIPLLTPLGAGKSFDPIPDGRLFEAKAVIASFEAKYAVSSGGIPAREHVYQALSTAAACGAPTAVLVYPGSFPSQVWSTSGFGATPRQLVSIGLDLFRCLPASEADTRGIELLEILDRVNSSRQSAASSGTSP